MNRDDFKNLYIFEMANNHQGSVEHGVAIIKAMGRVARQKGVRGAVKLQYRDLESFIHPDFRDREDVKHIPRFLSTRLSKEQFYELIQAVREEGMVTIVTPFDEASVDTCLEHGVDILKVASCSASDWPLLERISDTGRPVIISTAGVDIYGIDRIVSFFEHKKTTFAMMHCVGRYPTPPDALCLGFLDRMIRRYPHIEIGYSGHEGPNEIQPAQIAVAKGVTLLERHVGLPTDKITLNGYSMNPEQVEEWITAVEGAKTICGESGSKQISQDERDSLLSLKRGVYAKRDIKTGDSLRAEDVFFAMPCQDGQLDSGNYGRYRSEYTASRDYTAGAPVSESAAPADTIVQIREIIHDARGMLLEAQIVLGPDVQVELSHHEGLENFRRVGAVIANVVNRSYCKKIILVFPGQQHPTHSHKVKEETFQLLWGDLQVDVDGVVTDMVPGDTMLLEPGQAHSFTSRDGAIFEEVSTTHERNDSFYDDARIAGLDPMERKTLLNLW